MRPVFRSAGVLLGFVSNVLFSPSILAQTTINVPASQPTIQAGINAANSGDTVLVAPGTYSENLNFKGKVIKVTSSAGATQTIIDGGNIESVVTFSSGEGPGSVLNGFTLQHGNASSNNRYLGGGIYVSGGSPTITNNIIQNNTSCGGGFGIGLYFSSPLIQGNTITNNNDSHVLCSGGDGGGILVVGSGTVNIIGNVISNNAAYSGDGGGIALESAGSAVVKNNIVSSNTATGLSPAAQGGGIYSEGSTNDLIVQNILYGNNAGQGGGIYTASWGIIENNTVVGGVGSGTLGSALYSPSGSHLQMANNVIVGVSGENALYCDGIYDPQPPALSNNDAYSSGANGFGGTCSGTPGQNGNISADPVFVNPVSDFHLQPNSPAIDAGTNSAPNLPQTDFAGSPRILDGNNDCVSTVDMGAYELALKANVSLSSSSLTFSPQILNTTSAAKPVTLSNTGATCFQFSTIGTTGDYAENNTCSAGVRGGTSCTFNVTFDPTALGKRVGALNISGFDGTTNSNLSASMAGIGVDFSVAVSPTSVSVHHGQPITVKVSVTPLGGKFTNAIALSCSGMPAFSSCTFSPATVTPGELVATSTLTIAVGERAALGNFNILINGTSGSDVRTANLLVTIF